MAKSPAPCPPGSRLQPPPSLCSDPALEPWTPPGDQGWFSHSWRGGGLWLGGLYLKLHPAEDALRTVPASPRHPALARPHVTQVLPEGDLCCWLFHLLLLRLAEPLCRIQLGRLLQEAPLASSLAAGTRALLLRPHSLHLPSFGARCTLHLQELLCPPSDGSSMRPRASQPHSRHM